MIATSVAVALLLAAAPADPAKMPRKEFSRCLQSETQVQLGAKAAPEAFDQAIGPACAAQQAALRNALVSANMATGLNRKEAEEEASVEVDDYLANAKDMYREYLETDTKPES